MFGLFRLSGSQQRSAGASPFPTLYNYSAGSFRAADEPTTFDDAHSTWGRLSAATRWTSNQQLEEVANDVERFDHVPSSGAPRGLLLEEQRTNEIPNTDVGASSWTLDNVTVSSAGGRAQEIFDDETDSYHRVYFSGPVDGNPHSRTIEVKQSVGVRYVVLSQNTGPSSSASATIFDMQEGVYTQIASGQNVFPPELTSDGWYRIGFETDSATNSTARFAVVLSQVATGSGTDLFYVGGSGSILVRHPDHQEGDRPTSHIITEGTAQTRATENLAVSSAIIDPIAEDTLYWEIEATGADDLVTIGATVDHTVTAPDAGTVKIAARLGASGAVAINGTVTAVDLSGFTGWERAANPQMWLRQFAARGETLTDSEMEELTGV